MVEVELERTYLAKYLPQDISNFPSKEIIDIYMPGDAEHPVLRLRKRGEVYEITKKQPIHGSDSSEQEEHTIRLTAEEFKALSAGGGKVAHKIRYYYDYKGSKAEIDIFQGDLKGLVLVDFEFNDSALKNEFKIPEFCLADVTQDKIFAGGMLCGRGWKDIKKSVEEYGGYKLDY